MVLWNYHDHYINLLWYWLLFARMKRLHIGTSDDMHRCVKLFATFHDVTVNDVICKSIEMYLKNQTEYINSPLLDQEIKKLKSDNNHA